MGMAAILLNGLEPFEQNCQYPFDRRPYVNYVKSSKTVQAVSEKKSFKDFTILKVYSPRAWADSPKLLTVAKQFYYFNHTL